MPIRNCPIHSINGNDTTVMLPIKIINSSTSQAFKTWGLIDTGATECAIPGDFSVLLGHDLLNGIPKNVSTGNGTASCFGHTSTIEIYHPITNNVIYTLDNVIVDFIQGLSIPLLGVRGFLDSFILKIDYPQRTFSLTR